MTAICLFRRDLRLTDNPALIAAAAEGRVLAVFWSDPVLKAQGAATRWRLGRSLAALDADVRARNGRLAYVDGDADAFVALARAARADTVHAGAWPEPARAASDAALTRTLEAAGIRLVLHQGHTLIPAGLVRTGKGGAFKVFTPFARAARTVGVAAPRAVPAVDWAAPPPGTAGKLPALAPDMNRGAAVVAAHSPDAGEAAALCRLDAFVKRADGYVAGRDRMDGVSGSGLSDALAVGEISPRTIWAAAERMGGDPALAETARKFTDELLWRDFAWALLIESPHMQNRAWNARFDGFPYRDAPDELAAWQRGRTGEPLVDAGMRELFVTGRMHNRVRMVAASYLTKHLLIDWRDGLAWFADTLIDWDPASNALNWQWVAGSGPDASPFFRVFNPAGQAEKFDPDGAYRRRWLLGWQGSRSNDARAFFEAVPRAWKLDSAGYDPARPLVELAQGRHRALAALGAMARDGQDEAQDRRE